MLVNLAVFHPTANKRMYKTLDLPITELPKRDEVLNLSNLVKNGLPSVKVDSTYSGGEVYPEMTPEIQTILKNGGKFTASVCDKIFKYDDGWTVY